LSGFDPTRCDARRAIIDGDQAVAIVTALGLVLG
jgi:hypothetical protein